MSHRCIFCNQIRKMSKEHFWPQWLSKLLDLPDNPNYISDTYTGKGKTPQILTNRIDRQGDVTTKKFRVVCEVCNSGWMGDLEEEVKPIFKDILSGSYTLSSDNALVLSTWATVKVMVAEFSDKQTILTPDADRHLMHKSRKIPDYYYVYLGSNETINHAAYIRHSNTMSRTMSGPSPSIPRECYRNIQVITFLAGPIIFHVVAKRLNGLDKEELIPPNCIQQIWPTENETLSISRGINTTQFHMLAYWLNKVVENPRVKHGGEFKRDQT